MKGGSAARFTNKFYFLKLERQDTAEPNSNEVALIIKAFIYEDRQIK